ncbi:uncharacterized protein ASPGLDRAFT_1055953 [Aspergillus glaucus CBS 516.65]|uniref:Uncharacterized protein n=1 Tax=Aspergillus glaucus CBS 516.65 TaxID=1160497 RepID=A0A1L9V5V7_ASPGL|nr:hypothetical protein ASPGLDRAFT_1055953 [Aspergillus glaucus CBS 516.65]OJJ79314.1 hypothetical protein ASPGLDRAFT_1055953 [Aspergillus glaucus CBS 516.65]
MPFLICFLLVLGARRLPRSTQYGAGPPGLLVFILPACASSVVKSIIDRNPFFSSILFPFPLVFIALCYLHFCCAVYQPLQHPFPVGAAPASSAPATPLLLRLLPERLLPATPLPLTLPASDTAPRSALTSLFTSPAEPEHRWLGAVTACILIRLAF